MGAIATHVNRLDRALRGSRAARVDLLTEVRHGLLDAADAYEQGGVARPEAERRAVRDFGDMAAVAPALQAELAVDQARRTAFAVVGVLLTQPLVWERAWPAVAGIDVWDPSPLYVLVDHVVGVLAVVAIAAAAGALCICGRGGRHLGPPRALVRATGLLGFTVLSVFAAGGTALAALGPATSATLSVLGVAWWTAFFVAPLTWIGVWAHRCLEAAGPAIGRADVPVEEPA